MTSDLSRFVRGAVGAAFEGGRNPNQAPDPPATYGGGGEGAGPGLPAGHKSADGADDEFVDVEGQGADDIDQNASVDDTEDAGGELRSGADVAAWVLSQPGGVVELEDGSTMTGPDYLAAMADCSASEWAEFCDETGFDPSLRPSETDWPRSLETERIANRLDDRLAAIRRGEAPYL